MPRRPRLVIDDKLYEVFTGPGGRRFVARSRDQTDVGGLRPDGQICWLGRKNDHYASQANRVDSLERDGRLTWLDGRPPFLSANRA